MGEDAELAKAVRAVVDKQAIHEALMRYCRGVDRRDRDLIMSAFHPDAIDDHGTPVPASRLADGIAAGTATQMMHFAGNELIDLDGDAAYAESYFISFQTVQTDGATSTRTRAGRYLDRFERRAGEWKIAHRLVVDEWARIDPVVAVPDGIGVHRGHRSADDPVFQLRTLLRPKSSVPA